MANKRPSIKAILADPDLRRKLMVSTIQATQAREGIDTSLEQADRAYYVVTEAERAAFLGLETYKGGKDAEDRRHEMFVRALRANEGLTERVRFDVPLRDFSAIEGAPLAYQHLGLVASTFREFSSLEPHLATVKQGLATSDDERWVRLRWEVAPNSIGQGNVWAPFAKGGMFSRFYSDISLVILWRDDGRQIKEYTKEKWGSVSKRIYSQDWYFKAGLTWPQRTQKGFNVRLLPPGCVFGHKGPGAFPNNDEDRAYLLGVMNSEYFEFVLRSLVSFGSWSEGPVKKMPVPEGGTPNASHVAELAMALHDAKAKWDEGNEVSGRFVLPWLARLNGESQGLVGRLDSLIRFEQDEERRLRAMSRELDDLVYEIYGVPAATREAVRKAMDVRAPEVLWPEMEGSLEEQKRAEHIWRMLSFIVKRVVEADDDGVVPFGRAGGDAPLIDRVRAELAALFPERDEGQLEVELVNELKRTAKGYRKCSSLEDWLANAFFAYHASLYKNRPVFWHIASTQGTAPFAFGALVHYHRFDKNRLAKLRASYVRDTIEEYRREAALADKAGRAEDRLEHQAKVEEAQALDKKLQLIQEGHHEGPEGGDLDFRILTPWKEPGARPKGWNPDLDDGVKVNIGPFERAGVLRISGVAG